MAKLYTPFPIGEMPPEVREFPTGPPYGRIELMLDHYPSNGEVVLDHHTGEKFEITTAVDCGLGCRCSAEAKWQKTASLIP